MPKYTVAFVPDAEDELLDSYEWGVDFWGEERARSWLREMCDTIFSRLSDAPLTYPIAPESERLGDDVRQLIVGRYRVLFSVEDNEVQILHVRGPYVGQRE